MSDLIKRLREHGDFYRADSQYSGHWPAGDAFREAADKIARLRKALRDIIKEHSHMGASGGKCDGLVEIAHCALEDSDDA